MQIQVATFLVDDGVEGDSGLTRLPIADDQLALAAADRNHAIDGLDAGLHRLLNGLALNNAGRNIFDWVGTFGGDGTLAVDRTAERWLSIKGSAVPQLTVGDVRTVVTELFPRKISLPSPQQADDAIPELLAFWKYLKREFQLPQADAVLEFLREVEPDFPGMMNDPENFGMAKSFFTMGHAAGFDMTAQEGVNAFMLAFNASLLARQPPPRPSMPISFFPVSRPSMEI